MTYLFKRKVLFRVGRAGETGIEFSELRIQFTFDKDSSSNANKGKVSIYNLSPASLDLVRQEGQVYEFDAGYLGLNGTPLIKNVSTGDVLDVTTVRSGPDIVTTFKLGESTKALAEKNIQKSFAEGVTTKEIVASLRQALDVAEGTIVGLKDLVFNSGYSAEGKVKDRLDEIMEKQGLEWSVQNGEFQAYPKGSGTLEEVVLLTPDTGLLKAYKEKSEVTGSKALVDKIKFEALLNPEIKIGRRLAIYSPVGDIGESILSPSILTVRKIRYNGDNKTGAFTVSGEVD